MQGRWVVVVAGLVAFGIGVSAEAGVSGNTYSGVITENGVPMGTSCIEYLPNGVVEYNELFTGQPLESFAGTYTEFDLVLLSFWNAEFQDQSANNIFVGNGVSFLFGIFNFAAFENPDFSNDWQVIYTPSNCTVNVRTEEGNGAGGGGK